MRALAVPGPQSLIGGLIGQVPAEFSLDLKETPYA